MGRAWNKNTFFSPFFKQQQKQWYRLLQNPAKTVSMWSFCEWKLPHTVIVGQPSTNNELISRDEQRDLNSQRKKKKSIFSRNITMHSKPPLDNHDPQCRLKMDTSPCCWPIVTGGKPSVCQTLTSPPVQSKAAPAKQGGRQWWRKPSGRWLWGLASYLCPSLCSCHLSSSPAATFLCPHVVAENMQSLRPGIALQW